MCKLFFNYTELLTSWPGSFKDLVVKTTNNFDWWIYWSIFFKSDPIEHSSNQPIPPPPTHTLTRACTHCDTPPMPLLYQSDESDVTQLSFIPSFCIFDSLTDLNFVASALLCFHLLLHEFRQDCRDELVVREPGEQLCQAEHRRQSDRLRHSQGVQRPDQLLLCSHNCHHCWLWGHNLCKVVRKGRNNAYILTYELGNFKFAMACRNFWKIISIIKLSSLGRDFLRLTSL